MDDGWKPPENADAAFSTSLLHGLIGALENDRDVVFQLKAAVSDCGSKQGGIRRIPPCFVTVFLSVPPAAGSVMKFVYLMIWQKLKVYKHI